MYIGTTIQAWAQVLAQLKQLEAKPETTTNHSSSLWPQPTTARHCQLRKAYTTFNLENHATWNLIENIQLYFWDLNPEPSDKEAGALTTGTRLLAEKWILGYLHPPKDSPELHSLMWT